MSTLLLAIPTLMASTATSLTMLIVWRFLQGLVMPGIFGVAIAYIAEEWPPGMWRGRCRSTSAPRSSAGFSGASSSAMRPRIASFRRLRRVGAPASSSSARAISCSDLPSLAGCRAIARSLIAIAQADGGVLRHLRNPKLLATYAVGFNVLFSLVAIFTYITFHLAAPPYLLTPAQLSSLFVVYLAGLIVTPLAGIGIGHFGSRPVLVVAVLGSMIGVSMTLLHSLPLIMVGLVLCSSGVFVCQSASTSYIQMASLPGGRASAAGLYVACYYTGGSVSGVLPGYFWRFGGWTACVVLVLVVQLMTIGVAAIGWRES